MRIHVKLFAILRDRAGVSDCHLDLAEGASIAQASKELAGKFPALADFLPRVAFAVNQNYVGISTILVGGDELAVIPPVSGG